MSDSEKTPPDSSAVEEALDKIPGLADQVGSGPESKSEPDADSESDSDREETDEAGEQQPPQGVAPQEREPVEDSDAVQAALNQIPGLKDSTDDQRS